MRKIWMLMLMWAAGAAAWGGTTVLEPVKDTPVKITVKPEDADKTKMSLYSLKAAQTAGKRVIITAEVKRDINKLFQKWQGGKLMLVTNGPDGERYPNIYMPQGKFDWSKMTLVHDAPGNITGARVCLGIQGAEGEIEFRNVKVEVGDDVLDFSKSANMGFKDKVARDGQGGWSDQGPDNDAAGFPLTRREFANVPFRIIDPAQNNGKSVLVFKGSNFAKGLEEVQVQPAACKAKYLYLLHTLTFGSNVKTAVGTVTVAGKNGKTMTLEVMPQRDVADWWTPQKQVNAFPAAFWSNTSGGSVGVYVAKFALDPQLGEVQSVTFKTANSAATWIVVGATLSEQEYQFPAQAKVLITADAKWKAYPVPPAAGVTAGSALDVSWLNRHEPAGTWGRVIITPDGHFAFEKKPNETVRFFSTVAITDPYIGRGPAKCEFDTKERIQAFVRQLRLHGFNMVRMHFLDAVLMFGAKEDFEFNKKYLDQFDYFVYCLKENGIYINCDGMTSRIGYNHGDAWFPPAGDRRYWRLQIYFNPEVRGHWYTGVERLLTHQNPYTKTRLIDDPVLALMVGYNEQEFALATSSDFSVALPEWRAYLKNKYKEIGALKTQWGEMAKGYASFEQIPAFTTTDIQGTGATGDVMAFITAKEIEIGNWYRDSMRKMGFRGYITNFNMGQSLRNVVVRKDCDYVALNGYHAHPHGNSINQESSISSAGQIIRGFNSVHMYRKPFVITEIGHAFWNSYRYEQGFVSGAYSAFQNYDGFTPFATSVTTRPEVNPVATFLVKTDPVLLAQDFLTAFLLLRQDVTPAPDKVRIQVNSEELFARKLYHEALDSAQSRLTLVTGMTLEVDSTLAAEKGQTLIPASAGGSVVFFSRDNGGYTKALEAATKAFSLDEFVGKLKRSGQLPENNRTSAANEIYESSTGELLMDCRKNFMSVNAPRLQGVCAESGTMAKLRDVEIKQLSVRGNLAVVSVDGKKPIAEASRLVVVFATNALNSNMEFEDKERKTMIKPGTTPVLIETGKFQLTVRNSNADKLKAYALRTDGVRMAELPLKKSGGRVELAVDTATLANGPSLYFELAAE